MALGKRPQVAVIGGGIGGIAAGLCLAARGWAVTLLEPSRQLAAGWHSLHFEDGPIDLGLRVPMESTIGWADALVFHGDPSLVWHRMELPHEGHAAFGGVNPDTPCLDVRPLGPDLLPRALAEVLVRAEAPDPRGAAPNLAARWEAVFGPVLLRHALAPACLHLFGQPPDALAPEASYARLPARLVIASAAETDRLRRIGRLGERLAHPRHADIPGPSPVRPHLYPRQGGIGAWTAALERSLHRAGVALRMGWQPAAPRLKGARIAALPDGAGGEIACDLVVLAGQPRLLPIPGLPEVPDPRMEVEARLLTVIGAPLPPYGWLLGYDPALPFLRLGIPELYSGVGAAVDRPWRLLVETRPGTPTTTIAATLAGLGILPGADAVRSERQLGVGRLAIETLKASQPRRSALEMLGGLQNLAVMRSAAGGHLVVGDLVADAAALAERHALAQAA